MHQNNYLLKETKRGGWIYGKGNERSPIKILGTSREGRGVCKSSRVVNKIKKAVRGVEETKRHSKLLASVTVFSSMLSNIFSMLF